MTNATKTLLIIFSSLFVLTALVKWTSGPASSEAFLTTLVDVDPERVSKIRIEKPGDNETILLEEQSSGWMVSRDGSAGQYEADTEVIQRSLERLAELNVQAVVTRNPEKFTRYKVDSTGIKVSLFEDERLLSDLVIGAPQFVSQREFNNYVRPAGGEAVYSVEGFLESTFNRSSDRWRNKEVWDVDRNSITQVDFMYPADSSFTITRADDEHWISEDDTLSRSRVNTVLNRISSVNASGFVDSLSVSTFGPERFAVRFKLDDGSERTIKLKLHDHSDNKFVSTATGFPYVFTLSRSSWENGVLKSREELID